MKTKIIVSAVVLTVSSMASAQTREAAVLFSGTELDNSYLLTENVSVVFDEEGNGTIYKGETATGLTFDGETPVTAEFKDAFKLTANQDPDHEENYYSTFYTGGGAYKVPENAKAYIGEVVTGAETDVLKLADVGNIIHKSEAVILKATGSSITLMPSCNKVAASTDNKLSGTDVPIAELGANDYALTLGQNGVGFYQWNGKPIDAHKAYLTLTASAGAKAFTFDFNDGEITGILKPVMNEKKDSPAYNLNGVRVNDNYKGIVIKNGKKVYQK